jgi:DNA replication protein DnaC
MLFFQLMSRRYETASTALTCNKGFDDWGEILGDDVMAGALSGREAKHEGPPVVEVPLSCQVRLVSF